ncbi:flavin reductase [Crocosphaera sp. XPORK-15E]|uniref:flavin reductase n=1 Tax=Crocosphaera sp. XPORK-15E TaxID=3110247 RepID=UPI002B2118B6|nr:flavin reductase [Crocosphaera sp. XPORK-15E]MEA5534716.1 flavin reductase [Crocosphaera sp. XPORK-15E]
MSPITSDRLINLDLNKPLWDRFFSVAPLVIIGTKEADGSYDLAPKHLAMPFGWDNYFGFICTPRHGTYQNIRREKAFTVSFPQPDQVLFASLAAAPRCDHDHKPSLSVLPTFPASTVDGVLLQQGYLFLECQLDRIIDGFGENSLIVGKIAAAQVQTAALRRCDRDDQDILLDVPLLVYLSPGRYTTINHSFSFPFHAGFKR